MQIKCISQNRALSLSDEKKSICVEIRLKIVKVTNSEIGKNSEFKGRKLNPKRNQETKGDGNQRLKKLDKIVWNG